MSRVRLLLGDARERLAELEPESVHCLVTSPPYWQLRDYRAPGQLGLESSIDEHVDAIVAVFREARRVLRRDGIAWLNYGDSYIGNPPGGIGVSSTVNGRRSHEAVKGARAATTRDRGRLRAKDLVGMPWRVALAIQADGWILRSDVIYHKANALPQSVRDRPSMAHEYVFMFTRRGRYFYDAEAVREDGRRNARSVWTFHTEAFPEHPATFPQELPQRCIRASTSMHGVCADCGAQWTRIVERPEAPDDVFTRRNVPADGYVHGGSRKNNEWRGHGQKAHDWRLANPSITVGWWPSCTCGTDRVVPATVLDPFLGAGTTALVAAKEGRDAIGIEISPEYLAIAERRIRAAAPLFVDVVR